MKNTNAYRIYALKRIIAVTALSISVCGLTGCAVSVTSLSDEESLEVSHYMADKLLRYDSDYMGTELVYIDPGTTTDLTAATEEPAATEIPTASAEPDAADVPNAQETAPASEGDAGTDGGFVDGAEQLNTSEWSVTYSSHKVYKTYPKKSDIYAIEASKGKELLVVNFDVVNNTDAKVNVNLVDAGLNYVLYIGEDKYSPMIAILEDGGLMFLDVDLKPNASCKTELMFEIPENSDLSDIHLEVSR